MRSALKVARKQGRVTVNVAELVEPPAQAHTEPVRVTAGQARTFLTAAAGDPLYAYYALMLKRAVRPSELVALKWSDLSGDRLIVQRAMTGKGQARVEGPTKTAVVRSLVLDADLVAALDRHRARQAATRLKAGAHYVDRGYIFATRTGEPLDITSTPNHHFHEIAERAGLPRTSPYHLKHAAVSLLLESKQSPWEIAKFVGWTSPAMVMRYAAAHPGAQVRTAGVLDDVLAQAGAA